MPIPSPYKEYPGRWESTTGSHLSNIVPILAERLVRSCPQFLPSIKSLHGSEGFQGMVGVSVLGSQFPNATNSLILGGVQDPLFPLPAWHVWCEGEIMASKRGWSWITSIPAYFVGRSSILILIWIPWDNENILIPQNPILNPFCYSNPIPILILVMNQTYWKYGHSGSHSNLFWPLFPMPAMNQMHHCLCIYSSLSYSLWVSMNCCIILQSLWLLCMICCYIS